MGVVPEEGFEPSVEDPKSPALPLGYSGARGREQQYPRDQPPSPSVRSVMRALLLAGLLAATAACGAYSFPGQSGNDTGNVHGTVRIYPCAPVERQQGQMCEGIAGEGFTILFTDGSHQSSTDVRPGGQYSIDLPAGTWKVSFKGIARIVSGPNPITVQAGDSLEADYQVDSGI